MKKALLLTSLLMMVIAVHSYAQPNIFDPNDVVTTYSSTRPPTIPKANTMAKWVRTVRMSWNTDRFKCYYWNGMAFRLRFPNNYDPTKATKYPIMVFFHGAGEIAPVTDNENQLIWGAQPFESMMNAGTAGGLNNAFMLFPQAIQSVGWTDSLYVKVNSILDSLQKYCKIDPDRVVAQGLSNGGFGSLSYTTLYPTRVATVISASPALVQNLIYRQGNAVHIPTWISSGGLDVNPDPPSVNKYVDSFAAKGGNIRYTFYPKLSHNTWSSQWNEPYMVPYWTAAHKANPLLYFQRSQFCSDSAFSARMGLTPGFYQYQWQKDSVTIPNATSNEYSATQFGIYRARFKRTAASDWSDWSPNPIVITASASTTTPPINITGISSKVLPAPDGSTTTPLELPTGYNAYEWRNATTNTIVSTARTYAAPVGQVKARAFGCNATYSNFTIVSANGTPKPELAQNVTLTRISPTSIKVSWINVGNPNSDETGFEIYRGLTGSGDYKLAYVNPANTTSYIDSNLSNNYNYYYVVRAVNNTGASLVGNSATLQPSSDKVAPTTPASLKAVLPGRNSIQLSWDSSTDNVGVTQYDVYVNGVRKYSTPTNKIIADGLTPNTSYSFKVKAFDQIGNASAFSDSIRATTVIKGLKYSYYEGTWDNLPDFSKLTPVRVDTSANLNIQKRNAGVDDGFGFVWEGYINIKTPGTYTFETNSDDGSELYFNTFYNPTATPLVNNDGSHGAQSRTGSVTVDSAGLYPITITYFDKVAGESMQAYWSGPGITRQLIPDAAFTETYTLPVDNIAPVKPANLKAAYIGHDFVDLKWDSSTDNIGVTKYEVYVNGVEKYTTTGTVFTADSLDANTNFVIRVRALDLSGNASTLSDSVKVNTTVTNLKYKLYQGNWNALPDFSTLTPTQSGTTTNALISVKPSTLTTSYGFVWEGYINIKTAGDYTFETASDDGSKLYFNSFYSPDAIELVNNDGQHDANTAIKGTVTNLTPGMYPITITYFQKDLGSSIKLYWTGPGITRQAIPDSAFTENFSLPGDAVAPSKPGSMAVKWTARDFVELNWNKATDNVGVAGYDVYVNNVKKYTTTDTAFTADGLTPNVAYAFKVKAFDYRNNNSAFSDSVKVTTGAINLKYRYYQGVWDSLPNFDMLTPVKTGTTANTDLTVRPTGVVNSYGLVWEGYINIKTPGDYTFETMSDDGSKFYFNSFYDNAMPALVNNDGQHDEYTAKKGTVHVDSAGLYPVSITYFQGAYGATMKLYWTGPGILRQLVPDSAFTDKFRVATDNVAPTKPASLRSAFTSRTYVNLAWNTSTDNIAVTGYDVYVNGVKKYTTTDTTVKADNLTPGTAYTFKVKAFDFAGNNSAFSDSLKITVGANGLQYRYYQGAWDSLPNFNALTPVQTGSSPNADISVRPSGVTNAYGFVWEGYINIKTPGDYTFETMSDDGSKFYFNKPYAYNAVPLVNNDGQHDEYTAKKGSIHVDTAGLYPVAITYFQGAWGATMKLYWTGPGITRQLVPDAAFTESFALATDNVAPTKPASLKSVFTSRTYANLVWNRSTDNIAVTGYEVWVNGAKKYSTTDSTIKADSLTANTAYTFKVRAYDFAGNFSAFSDSLKITPGANGLQYRYYEGSWNVLPNFNTLTPVQTGSTPNIDISVRPSGVINAYGFVWEGYINIKTAGDYTFETASDDGSKFYFNTPYSPTATTLVDNDGQHDEYTPKKGTIHVDAPGLYPVAITYFQGAWGATMKLYWTGPNIPRQLVPDAAFTEGYTAPTDTVPPTKPTSLKATYTSRTYVDLAWNSATDGYGVTGYDVYVNGVKKYTTADTTIKADSLNANVAYTFKVKAFDKAANFSAFSDSLKVTTGASGFKYRYYEGTWDSLPNFNALTPVKTGSTPNVDISVRPAGVDYRYGFVWEGYINIKTAGDYTFETMSDDGSKFYFNTFYSPTAAALVNNDGQHDAYTAKKGTVHVSTPGLYPVAITFFQRDWAGTIAVYWSGPGITRQLIPNAAFTEGFSGVADDSTAVSSVTRTAAAEAASETAQVQISNAYPNPFNEALNISFMSKVSESNVDVALYDMAGRMVYNRHFGKISAGATTLRLDLSAQPQLKTGTYFARLNINGQPVKTWTLIRTRN